MSIYEKLAKVQAETVATKDAYSDYGDYHYRSCESILEAVKPILQKYNCTIILYDCLKQVADRIYVEAHARFVDCESGESTDTIAYAREPQMKKKMDESQVTGSSSSYARKYALSGLLLLDDNKDSDALNGKEKAAAPESARISETQVKSIKSMLMVFKTPANVEKKICEKYGIKDLTELTVGNQFVKCRNEVLKLATAEKSKGMQSMLDWYTQQTGKAPADALAEFAELIGKANINDVSVAEYPAIRAKVTKAVKNG